jgi:hypothetical protein
VKITHNPHGNWERPSAAVSAGYEAEVEQATHRSEREYRRRQERLARAEEKLARARASSQTRTRKKLIAELVAMVEMRRQELEEYRRMMVSSPASAEHRGRKSFRPVPSRYDSGV